MIPAALETLYDIETPCEEAWKTLLGRYGMPAFGQRQVDELPSPRVDVQFALGAHTGHRKVFPGRTFEDAWQFRLTLRVTTNVKPKRAGESHAAWRARIRILAQYGAQMLDESVLPHHVLSGIVSAGASPEVTSEDDCHVSELAFNGTVSIRSNAWPQAAI